MGAREFRLRHLPLPQAEGRGASRRPAACAGQPADLGARSTRSTSASPRWRRGWPDREQGVRPMMAAIFIAYMAIIWLVFDKLRLMPLSLPLALRPGGGRAALRVLHHRLDEQLPSVLGRCAGVPARRPGRAAHHGAGPGAGSRGPAERAGEEGRRASSPSIRSNSSSTSTASRRHWRPPSRPCRS